MLKNAHYSNQVLFFFTKASPKFSRSSKSYIMEITLIYMDIEILNMQN